MSPPADSPNVLFIISDQHKQSVTGCYGDPLVRTPNIDRLAADGVRFDNAYCQAPLCGPSRASVLTGRHCHSCRVYTHGQKTPLAEVPTLGSVFREAGHVTGAIGKVHVLGESAERDLGFDDRQMRFYTYHFRDYIDAVGEDAVNRYATYRKPLADYRTVYNFANAPLDLDESLMFDALVVERCIEFMTRHRGERFFLWAGLEKPHPDWYAPAEFHRMYDPAAVTLPETLRESSTDIPEAVIGSLRQARLFTDEEVRHCIAAYYANVTYADAKVGQLLDALERLGLADNTVVVYTTDHGESLFEHGLVQKHCFFDAAVKVPLILRRPGRIPAKVARDGIVSLIDLFPTLLDLAGIKHPPGLEGVSLTGEIEGATPPDDRAALAEFYEWGMPERMIRTGPWKYVHTAGDVAQLYDVVSDPLEQVNLAARPEHHDVCRRLRRRVLDGWDPPDMVGIPHTGPWHRRKS